MTRIEITENEWLILSDVILEKVAYLEDVKMRYQSEYKTTKLQAREAVNSMKQRVFTYQTMIDDLNTLYEKMAEEVHKA